MNRFTAGIAALAIAWTLAPWARAEINAGDKPKLEFKAVDGTSVSLKQLDGKIVVVDFWATWCGPCMQEAGHMVAVNEKYKEQGLQFIGVSLDDNRNEMMQVAQQSGFVWPQYFDGRGWKNELAVSWGVRSIPQTFVISPDGVVLWRGHPAQIDAVLADAFAKHPPRLVDAKTLASAKTALDAAEKALEEGNQAAVIKTLGKFPADARKDKEIGQRLDGVLKKVEEYANSTMTEAESLVEGKKYGEALAKLQDLGKLSPMPVAAKANEKIRHLMSIPEARTAVAEMEKAKREEERAAKAEAALAGAQKLQADKKDGPAYTAFKAVAASYAGTPAATTAAEEVAKYEKDENFVKNVLNKANDAKARSALSMANSYANAGRNDLARQKYQAVIDQFPGSSYADEARKAMEKLPRE